MQSRIHWLGIAGVVLSVVGCGSSDSSGNPAKQNDADSGAGGASVGNGGVTGGGGFVGNGGVTGGGGVIGGGGFVGNGGVTGGGGVTGTGGIEQGGLTGTGGALGTGGAGATSKPPCISTPSEAVIIGDSYVTGALSPALQPALATLVPSAAQFRNYAVPGTSMATGGITGLIPPQFDQATAVNPDIKFSIMDGGGNDILLCNGTMFPGCATTCNTTGSSSQKICTDIVDQALTAADALMSKAADAGVKDVIYFFYPHIPANNGGYKEILDYAAPLAKAKCDGAFQKTSGKMNCYFVDLRQPFIDAGGDMNVANFAIDGIHPSQAGQNIIAAEISKVMTAQCLAQPASSGCCTP